MKFFRNNELEINELSSRVPAVYGAPYIGCATHAAEDLVLALQIHMKILQKMNFEWNETIVRVLAALRYRIPSVCICNSTFLLKLLFLPYIFYLQGAICSIRTSDTGPRCSIYCIAAAISPGSILNKWSNFNHFTLIIYLLKIHAKITVLKLLLLLCKTKK